LGSLLILEIGLRLPVGNELDGVVAWWLETGLGLLISAWWWVLRNEEGRNEEEKRNEERKKKKKIK
jgi:hypothetical protein